nr:hypothetical protein [Frondihabitans sucicola]
MNPRAKNQGSWTATHTTTTPNAIRSITAVSGQPNPWWRAAPATTETTNPRPT